jgi:UDP-3-O-[3-hydroxymyristoyl] glucosamine N-acyltransferase
MDTLQPGSKAAQKGPTEMQHPGFFEKSGPFAISELAHRLGLAINSAPDDGIICDVKTLQDAGSADASFFNNRKYLDDLANTRAGVCIIAPEFAAHLPPTTVPLITDQPYETFADALRLFYPNSQWPCVCGDATDAAAISASAQIEKGAIIEPTAVIGPEACIGSGTRVAAGAVVGYRCTIGRNCFIGPRTTIIHTLMGNNVTVHSGASIGQDGFGFAMGADGHRKVPQIGRVVIQDDVEIGANTTIDRGALNDTTIGQGTKIDNLVQIGHNVVIGRHCVIVALTGIAGSCELGDFVVMAGKSGLSGHLKVGSGAQIAGTSHPINDVPPGAKMGGTPARPYRQWVKEQAVLRRLANRSNE